MLLSIGCCDPTTIDESNPENGSIEYRDRSCDDDNSVIDISEFDGKFVLSSPEDADALNTDIISSTEDNDVESIDCTPDKILLDGSKATVVSVENLSRTLAVGVSDVDIEVSDQEVK